MCDVCADFLHLLVAYETRINSNDSKHPILHKSEVDIAFGYIQTWPQRQCMCCYRDIKNYERFNLVVQSLICLTVCQLKNIQQLIDRHLLANQPAAAAPAVGDDATKKAAKANSLPDGDRLTKGAEELTNSSDGRKTDAVADGGKAPEDMAQWHLYELEKLLILVSKAFLLNFPLYIAYKHGVHSRLDDITAQEAQNLSMYCDLHDTEIPAFLLRNVNIFCNNGGFAAMMHCFELATLPVSTAHAITATISNLKLLLNYRSVVQLFVPLRVKVLQYMCKLGDQDLRSPATKSMADFMWAAIKDPLDTQVTFDTDGLALAFKYFTSTTLTMRLAGMAQINAHINLFNDICTSETVAEVEIVGQKLADWLTEYQIIAHLFGPNLHAEVIKQSHIVLNFLAVENQITEDHINLIWQAAHLKHCSKPIYDILPSLVKNLSPGPALHLYTLLCKLDPKEHTEQSIYITSALTKLIWSRDGNRLQAADLIGGATLLAHQVDSSSENSVSIDGSNSDDDHPDDSSDGHKSHIDIEGGGSDSGPTPCKQSRSLKSQAACCDETTDDSSKIEDTNDVDNKSGSSVQRMNRRLTEATINVVDQPTSSDECMADSDSLALRKKMRKRRRKNSPDIGAAAIGSKKVLAAIDAISDSPSDDLPNVNDSDCSDTFIQAAMLSRLHAAAAAAVANDDDDAHVMQSIADSHLIDLLSGAENDGSYSSPLSNKSEKNMGDFDEDDESPCDEELAQLASVTHAAGSLKVLPSSRPLTALDDQLTWKGVLSKAGSVSSSTVKSSATSVSSNAGHSSCVLNTLTGLAVPFTYRVTDVCKPGNTLLWDLLMDDKIGQLGESLALEAEKALGTLVCFNTERVIRTKFIEGCLLNLATNRSVVVSLRLLPKLLASFQQYRATDTHQVTIWAERQHKMMHHFFNNLRYYAHSSANQFQGQVLNQNGNLMYTHLSQVQVRLQFLTSIFSTMGSPESFRLSLEQVDALWAWLSNDAECADCLFAWLQSQAKGSDQHALGIETLQHLYLKKLPELKPEGISMVALGLFQQLCSLARLAAVHYETDSSLDIVGMSHLWKIALRAINTDVSLASIQYINSYYMGQQLKLEKEFVAHCMKHLSQAAADLSNLDNQENALMCVQRALMLLNTHLETFRRRYAYHLRRWALEGKSFGSHSSLRNDGVGPPIRVVLQPGGLPDKTILHMHLTDLVADLKAEIAKWWESLQGGAKHLGAAAPVLGLLLSEGPLRIITQGQEITSEYDERSLSDVGFKDNQMVYVSLGGRGAGAGRRREPHDHPSLQPAPPKECLPTLLLLQPKYFEELFRLMQTLGDMRMPAKGGHVQPHTKAQLLSRRVWDILTMLPTNADILERFKNPQASLVSNASSGGDAPSTDKAKGHSQHELQIHIQEMLNPNNLQKFMYSLHIVESLSKAKNSGCCGGTEPHLLAKSKKHGASKAANNHHNNYHQNNHKSKYGAETTKKSDSISDHLHESVAMADATNKTDRVDTDSNDDSSRIAPRWNDLFIRYGGLRHLFDIFMSGMLQSENEAYDCNEWRNDCLATLLRIMCLLGVDELKPEDSLLTVPDLNVHMKNMMEPRTTLKRLSSILNDAALPHNPHQFKTGFWGRSQVIHYAMNLLVCLVHSSAQAREYMWSEPGICDWLQNFILDDPDPAVRREACAGLYRICLGNSMTYHALLAPLLSKLISFLGVAEKMDNLSPSPGYVNEDGKEQYGPACRDYFWLLCRLVDTLTPEMVKESLDEPHAAFIDIEALCCQIAASILKRDYLETRYASQDDGLVGMINLMANLIKYDPPFKFGDKAQKFIGDLFDCLFDLPSPQNRQKPKCKSQSTRAAAYDLLVELCRSAPKNFTILHGLLIAQHRPGPHSPYPWDYWPRDDCRSECGYVGLTNLGATCYMASCIQHLFMMPQARELILGVDQQSALKHAATLHELQRMFAYLMESERKSYNPRSFCRVYQMDHQPLNTGEQKDMAEFFIDLVSKLEEMSPDLKTLIKHLFCGTLSNNVVSLDCGHVSRTLEEFYTVRCQVADMRNLQESLDEVTVKDTLEGDNMYTCSQCGRKVRAEKRACFKKLPQILCFNTMRYTFNMLTMLKEKVNTHFSFPMRLDMSGYVEKTLMDQQYRETNDNGTNDSADDGGKKLPAERTASSPPELEDVNEGYEYDLVGVTVHTGTADGGHYYSFIKERCNAVGQLKDRWFLFNDAEVKVFDPSQIATECFGGEMVSKTYDSVTEKYLDFSFEKTNSAYMLFYERRSSSKATDKNNASESSSTEDYAKDAQQPSTSCTESTCDAQSLHPCCLSRSNRTNEPPPAASSPTKDDTTIETDPEIELLKSNLDTQTKTRNSCDIVIKERTAADDMDQTLADAVAVNSQKEAINAAAAFKPSTQFAFARLNKELEDWIWQDNRHFLQDRNIFEHTYFNFMWQICGHIPQTLLMHRDVTCIATQLSVSFFIETFIHAKEKPTMVLWVELLTKQFNANPDACEWFLSHMSTEPWWPIQVLIQCPNQMVRQMFQRLVIHVIQRLRQSHCELYLKVLTPAVTAEDATTTPPAKADTSTSASTSVPSGPSSYGDASCVSRFIKSLIVLMEHNAKSHLRNLSEFFGLLYEFSRMGEEEAMFLLKINVIRSMADFYLGHKSTQDGSDSTSDNDDNSSDEALSVDKARPASLDKMIALVASLVERSRGSDLRLHLSPKDYNAVAGGKGFPFLYQQIKDNINPHQTRHLIHALCRWDERLANQIIAMLFTSVTKHTELCGPFFKLLTLLTESAGGPSGLPCFSQLVLQRVWDAAEYCPQSALDWLAVQAPRNKIAHAWILQSADSWVEQFLLAHNNSRVRNAAAYLLVSLIPSQSFRSNYRATSLKMALQSGHRELGGDAQIILQTILNMLLRLLRPARSYTEISVHGTGKLTAYFGLMTYCMVTRAEKVMLGPFIRSLWELFHPRLSEPSVPAHHNKQSLLAFWHHATADCPENAQLMASAPEITRNIAFNYILADHDDSEIVAYNRAMLPAYYGLLRLCCQQSRSLTRQLAAHQNLQWAFKNITPHPTQYAMAVEELFRLMTLFAVRHPDATDAEQREVSSFRKTTLSAYLSGLDARVSWGTLIAALRTLVDNDDDRLFVVFNGGIAMCFEALHTLHSMYHEATACHVSGDLQELLAEMVLLVGILRVNSREQKKRPPPSALKGLADAVRRLATLLNTYNPPEMRNLACDVLKEFVRNSNLDVTSIIAPLFAHCHTQAQNSPNTIGPFGPYFPRRGAKVPWPTAAKSNPRPPRPMVQMSVPQSHLVQRGVDKEFDASLDAFYRPYHDFLDVMLRMAVNTGQLNEALVNLSCLAGIEASALHFNLFPKFWVGIHNNANTNKYVDLLVGNSYLVDFVDTILRDERISLNDPIVMSFMEIYLPKVTSRIPVGRLLESIFQVILAKENYEDLSGDLLAIRLLAQSTDIPTNCKSILHDCLKKILARFSDEFRHDDETPPKKRRRNSDDTTEVTRIGPQLEVSPVVSTPSAEGGVAGLVGSSTPSPTTKLECDPEPNAAATSNETNSAAGPSTSTQVDAQSVTPTADTSASTSDTEFKEENEFERKLLKKIELSILMLLDFFKVESPGRTMPLKTLPVSRRCSESAEPMADEAPANSSSRLSPIVDPVEPLLVESSPASSAVDAPTAVETSTAIQLDDAHV